LSCLESNKCLNYITNSVIPTLILFSYPRIVNKNITDLVIYIFFKCHYDRILNESGDFVGTSFPERLKTLREQFGYTQDSLGKRINVSAAAINRYEKGLRNPDPDMLCLLADLFETSVDDLLGREEKKKK
jgi:putative transcriptional regulator